MALDHPTSQFPAPSMSSEGLQFQCIIYHSGEKFICAFYFSKNVGKVAEFCSAVFYAETCACDYQSAAPPKFPR